MTEKNRETKVNDEVPSPTRNIRSPCRDSHYEAYILQSRWTVGNLYASNLYLGQTHVKYVQHLDREQGTWLHGKEIEQQKLAKRLEQLEALKRSSARQGSMTSRASRSGAGRQGRSSERILSQRARTNGNLTQEDELLVRLTDSEKARQESLKARVLAHGARSSANQNDDEDKLETKPSEKEGNTLDEQPERKGQTNNALFYPLASTSRLQAQGTITNGTRRKIGKSISHYSTLPRRYSSTGWTSRRKTSLPTSARLSGSSYDRGGASRLVPKWVPMTYRLLNVRAPR